MLDLFSKLKRWCDNDDVSEALRHEKKWVYRTLSLALEWDLVLKMLHDVWQSAYSSKEIISLCAIRVDIADFFYPLTQSRRHIKGILSSFKHTCMITFLNNIDDDTSFLRSLFFCSSAPVVMHTTRRRAPADAAPIGLRNDKNVTFSRKKKQERKEWSNIQRRNTLWCCAVCGHSPSSLSLCSRILEKSEKSKKIDWKFANAKRD